MSKRTIRSTHDASRGWTVTMTADDDGTLSVHLIAPFQAHTECVYTGTDTELADEIFCGCEETTFGDGGYRWFPLWDAENERFLWGSGRPDSLRWAPMDWVGEARRLMD